MRNVAAPAKGGTKARAAKTPKAQGDRFQCSFHTQNLRFSRCHSTVGAIVADGEDSREGCYCNPGTNCALCSGAWRALGRARGSRGAICALPHGDGFGNHGMPRPLSRGTTLVEKSVPLPLNGTYYLTKSADNLLLQTRLGPFEPIPATTLAVDGDISGRVAGCAIRGSARTGECPEFACQIREMTVYEKFMPDCCSVFAMAGAGSKFHVFGNRSERC